MIGSLRWAVLPILVLTVCRIAHAGTYYVAPGGSDGWPGSASQPWATIQHAAETLGPGDTVFIKLVRWSWGRRIRQPL